MKYKTKFYPHHTYTMNRHDNLIEEIIVELMGRLLLYI